LTGVAGPSSEAVQWSGCDSVNLEGKCVVAMSAARAVTATFAANPELTVAKAGPGAASSTIASSPAGIACGATCSAAYGKGTPVTLSAIPGPHVKAAQWTGCDSVSAGKCTVAMNAARLVSASFELEAGYAFFAVTVERAGNGQGTVTGSPGSILCGAICAGEFLTGTQLALVATPAAGSVFAHWSGGGCSGVGTCAITIKAPKAIKAIFSLSGQRTLSVTKAGTGQGAVIAKAAGIDCGSTCSAQVSAGRKVSLSARAASGSSFAHWSGACAGVAKSCVVAMTEARSVTATFTAPPASAQPPAPAPRPLRCKHGFKKRRAHGKARCVRAGMHHHRHRHRLPR
jgi:hypothetical protein